MRIRFKMTQQMLATINNDLSRRHRFAAERVGFISCGVGSLSREGIVILAHGYHPVDDEDYMDNPSAGATMNATAIRKALQFGYHNAVAMFHVHMHEHKGVPRFSRIDDNETALFVPDFWNVRPERPHGAIILSEDAVCGKCWYPNYRQPFSISEFAFIGHYSRCIWSL